MINFSGASKTTYQTLRQSLVFIGDSITWGHGLTNQTQTIAYKIQQHINSRYTYTPATWGASGAYDIVARNIMMDDTTNSPFNGGQFTSGPILDISGATIAAAGVGIYPFSDATGNSTSVTIYSGWNDGAITLEAGSITFTANYPNTNNGYTLIGAMGAGKFQLLQGTTDLGTYTVGAIITGTVSSGSATMTNVSITYGTVTTGSYLYTSGFPTGNSATTVSAYSGGSSLTMSTTSTIDGTYTFYSLAGVTQKFFIGPFSANGSSSYSIKWIADLPVITMLHPTTVYPTTYTTIQINARNSYGIADYSSIPNYPLTGENDVIAKEIMAMTLHDDTGITGGYATRPTYIISTGINDIVARAITPADYSTELTRLANALTNTGNTNHGRVILTVPLIPSSGWSTSLGTYGDYRKAIISVAKSLSLSYIDLSRLNLSGSDYIDGIHPNDAGTTKIAKYYISMLEL